MDVMGSLDEDVAICQVIGFDPEFFEMLPRSIGQFLGPDPAKTTFRQFVMESGNGLRRKDAVQINDEVTARVGAARVSKWLERLVLPEQDIIVDAPHLVSRYPSLLTGDTEKISTWNIATQRVGYESLGLLTALIEPFLLQKAHWVSRPVWLWDKVRECEEITEVAEPWKTKRPNWVFCEDASRYYEMNYRAFIADTESPFSRRFVRRFEGIDYRPSVRFSI